MFNRYKCLIDIDRNVFNRYFIAQIISEMSNSMYYCYQTSFGGIIITAHWHYTLTLVTVRPIMLA